MTRSKTSLFRPLNAVTFVSSKGVETIPPRLLTSEMIGLKALGLSCLPVAWTLPFIVVSKQLLEAYRSSMADDLQSLLNAWIKRISRAALSAEIKEEDLIIIRSSACEEGLDDRGKYASAHGSFKQTIIPLTKCLEKIINDKNISKDNVPLVVQKYVDPISAKGHLSNERRCSRETRDWMGEFEQISIQPGGYFQIRLRKWRKEIVLGNKMENPLLCNLSPHISEVLKIPATWITDKHMRVHFEWVWDSNKIYIVQADQEQATKGVDPTILAHIKTIKSEFKPQCIAEINSKHAGKFAKIRNVFTYRKLKLPTTKIYVLEDQEMISGLAKGEFPRELKSDLKELVKSSLVIRMDTTSKDQNDTQLLPRTNEVRSFQQAVSWLKEHSKLKSQVQVDVAFIFHNFIPAVSSAFAYAAPGERKVLLEVLWGVPEGLYYNAHDKYVVDTQSSKIEKVPDDTNKFNVYRTPNYKKYFITPNKDGDWTTQIVRPPHDWGEPVTDTKLIKEIAVQSRRIAEFEQKPLSIMWFVGVPKEFCSSPLLPWYHEYFDASVTNRAKSHRKKTPFDKSLIIRTSEDFNELRLETQKDKSSVRRIRIQPREDRLLREKNTLKVIGDLAKKIGAVILLEGGVLSHAYYQLMQTGATVEVEHPFDGTDEKQEINKLVRDKIPSAIQLRGELVDKINLDKESHLRALKEKLIEEAVEVLDATDQALIVSELADVMEVIDGIVHLLKIKRKDLKSQQEKKRTKVGGFKKGIVLLKTKNPIPTKKKISLGEPLFEDLEIIEANISPPSFSNRHEQAIYKKTDKREHGAATEILLKVRIPLVRDSWVANTPETSIVPGSSNSIIAKLSGKRTGSEYEIELSVFSDHKQLPLFPDKSDKK